jgi:peptide subunit release factor 1 (eRF1)
MTMVIAIVLQDVQLWKEENGELETLQNRIHKKIMMIIDTGYHK